LLYTLAKNTRCILGGWVGPRAGLDEVKRSRIYEKYMDMELVVMTFNAVLPIITVSIRRGIRD
jgi:hypothetical protein